MKVPLAHCVSCRCETLAEGQGQAIAPAMFAPRSARCRRGEHRAMSVRSSAPAVPHPADCWLADSFRVRNSRSCCRLPSSVPPTRGLPRAVPRVRSRCSASTILMRPPTSSPSSLVRSNSPVGRWEPEAAKAAQADDLQDRAALPAE
jgi:hypothetical protein